MPQAIQLVPDWDGTGLQPEPRHLFLAPLSAQLQHWHKPPIFQITKGFRTKEDGDLGPELCPLYCPAAAHASSGPRRAHAEVQQWEQLMSGDPDQGSAGTSGSCMAQTGGAGPHRDNSGIPAAGLTQHSRGRRAPSCVCSLQLHLKSHKVTGSVLFPKGYLFGILRVSRAKPQVPMGHMRPLLN